MDRLDQQLMQLKASLLQLSSDYNLRDASAAVKASNRAGAVEAAVAIENLARTIEQVDETISVVLVNPSP